MRFGKIDNLLIFGGEQRLVNFILAAKHFKINNIVVFSGNRLLRLRLNKESVTLENYLKKKRIRYFKTHDINSYPLEKYINNNTLGVSFGAPWIFSKTTINKFKGRFINGHGMDLPRNRGAGGFSWQIMRGEKSGCHLFHLIDEGVDSGNIIFRNRFVFPKNCIIPKDYINYFEATEKAFFRDFFKKLLSNFYFREITQQESRSTYFPRLSTIHHGFVNWEWNAVEICRFICAFDYPYKGVSSFINGKRIFMRGAKTYYRDGVFHPFMRGLIYRKFNGYLFIAVSDGAVLIKEIYSQNGEEISSKIKPGYRFVTPNGFLDKALFFRAVYDADGLKLGNHKKYFKAIV